MGRIDSFTSANAIPVKLFMTEGVKELRPVHVNWYPTNVCNLNCEFCSCANRQKNLSMDYDTAVAVIRNFAELGCKAVSISGGGEPLCHPRLADMIAEFFDWNIKVGMVTNGTLLDRLNYDILNMLQWCRISCSAPFDSAFTHTLDKVVDADVDWAFSCVVGKQPDIDKIVKLVEYANSHNFTHVRLVGDLKEPHLADWTEVRRALSGRDRLVIYQERKQFVPSNRCWLGYVKPVVNPDWKMYLCCGVQYALENMTLDNPPELCMGDARHLDALYDAPVLFGVECVRCYYDNYNAVLQAMRSEVMHKEFV